MGKIITLGEAMCLFLPNKIGAMRYSTGFEIDIGGAELNTAVGLTRLGHKAVWLSKIGDDEFGEYILKEARGEGVDVSFVKKSAINPTGIMFKERGANDASRVFYYRKGSAASTISQSDLTQSFFDGADIIHLTGIAPALSESCLKAVEYAFAAAKERNIKISFDPNIRLKLWEKEKAFPVLKNLLFLSDIALLGKDEGEKLLNVKGAENIAGCLISRGVSKVAIKDGANGVYAADRNGGVSVPAFKVKAIDTVGAGDAFNAGFLAGILEGKSLSDCACMGAGAAAFVVCDRSDYRGFPDRKKLEDFLNNQTMSTER